MPKAIIAKLHNAQAPSLRGGEWLSRGNPSVTYGSLGLPRQQKALARNDGAWIAAAKRFAASQ